MKGKFRVVRCPGLGRRMMCGGPATRQPLPQAARPRAPPSPSTFLQMPAPLPPVHWELTRRSAPGTLDLSRCFPVVLSWFPLPVCLLHPQRALRARGDAGPDPSFPYDCFIGAMRFLLRRIL